MLRRITRSGEFETSSEGRKPADVSVLRKSAGFPVLSHALLPTCPINQKCVFNVTPLKSQFPSKPSGKNNTNLTWKSNAWKPICGELVLENGERGYFEVEYSEELRGG